MTNLDSVLEKQRYHFAGKSPSGQSCVFSSSHVPECESWTIKKAEHRRIDAFKLILESPLDSKEIKSVNSKGNQF